MGKTTKYTFEFANKKFEECGYKLLETEYVNSRIRMKFLCPEHSNKDTRISFSNLMFGQRCAYCSGNVKHTYEEVKEKFCSKGYELLETEYKNAQTKMKYYCLKHPQYIQSIGFNTLQQGSGCAKCGDESTADKNRTPYEEVKIKFEELGYELLETKYINQQTPMKYICPHHPDEIRTIRFSILSRGGECQRCAAKKVANKTKKSYEDVKELFSKRGYELLETQYIDSKTKMKYHCPTHPDKELFTSYGNILRGHGCPYCAGMGKQNFEEVNLLFMEKGFELLETEYINSHTQMRYKCRKHPEHIQKTNFTNLQQKRAGCSYCARVASPMFKDVKNKFAERGYELLETEYINNSTKMKYRCSDHPDKELYIRYQTLLKGHGCPYCAGQGQPSFEEVKNEFIKRGYELLETKYSGCDKPMKYICPNHPEQDTSISYFNLKNGQGCAYCVNVSNSKLSIKVENELIKNNTKFIREYKFEDCRHIHHLRFDFYLPNKNICIEVDGKQHFNPIDYFGGKSEFEKIIKRDEIKNDYCKKKGIKLIRIPYYDSDKVETILNDEIFKAS